MPFCRRLVLFFVLALLSGAGLWAQSRMPANTSAWLFSAYRGASDWYGDVDKVQVVFFEVDDTVTTPLYFGVYDPGMDSSDHTINNPGDMAFRVYGGTGAYTDSTSRALTFSDVTTARAGTLLSSLSIAAASSANAAYNDQWVWSGAINPSQGEHVGNKYLFKYVVVAAKNPDTNAYTDSADDFVNRYQVAVSTSGSGNPVALTTVRAFAYSLALSLEGYVSGGVQWDLFPFVPEGTATTDYVRIHSFDADYRAGNDHATATGFNWTLWSWDGTTYTSQGKVVISGDGTNGPGEGSSSAGQQAGSVNGYAVAAAGNTGRTWKVVLKGGGENGGEVNGTDFWASSSASNTDLATATTINVGSGTALRIYAAEFVAPTADHVVLTPSSQTVSTSATASIGLQIVDSSGNAVPVAKNVRVQVTGSAVLGGTFASSRGTTDKTLTTGTDGTASFTLTDSTTETVTLSLGTDGTSGYSDNFGAGTDGTATVAFTSNPPPTISSASNLTLATNSSSPQTLPTLTLVDSGTSDLTVANDLRVILPAGLGAVFDTSVTSVTLAGANSGTLSGITYTNGNKTAFIPIPISPSVGTTTITGLKLASPFTASSGSLGISWTGSATAADATDDKVITIVDASAVTWNGSTSTDWSTAANWSPAAVPSGTSKVTIPSGLATYPVLTAAGTASTLTIASGATLDLAGFNLTVGGLYTNAGTLKLTGAQTVSFGSTADTGTTELTSGGSATGGLSSYYHLNVSGGTHTAAAAQTVSGNLTVASGATLSLATNNLTVTGTTTVTGTLNGGSGTDSFASVAGTGTLSATSATTSVTGTLTVTTLTPNGGTVEYKGSTAQTVGYTTLASLKVNNASGVSTSGALTLTGGLTLTSGTLALGTNSLAVAGNITTASGLLTSTGTLTLNGSSAQTVGLSGSTVTHLTVNNATGATLSGLSSLAGNLTLTSGTLTPPASWAVAGNITSAGGTLGTTALTLNGSTAQTVNLSTGTLTSLTVNNTFGTAPQVTVSGGNVTVTGAVTLTAGTLALGSNNLSFGGALTRTSGVLTSSGTVTLNASGATAQTADFTGSTLTGTVALANAGRSGAVTLTALSVPTLTAVTGTYALTMAGGGSVTNALTLPSTGALAIPSGFAFTGGVTASAASSVSLGGTIAATNANLVLSPNVTLTAAATVSAGSGTLTLGGTVTGGGFGLTLNTLGSASLGGAASGLGSLTVNTGSTLTLGGNLTTTGALTVTSSTLAVGANAASFAGYAGAGGTVSLTGGGSLTNTGAASTIPTLTVTGAVTLAGGSGLTATAATYTSSPSVTTTGTVSLPGGTLGALTVTSGALTLGSAATTVTSATLTAGSLTMTGNLTSTGAVAGAGTLALGGNTLSFDSLSMASGTITTTSGTLTTTGAGGTVGTLTVTTGATLDGGSGATGLVVTNAVAGNLNLTGKVTLNGSVGTVSTSGPLTLNGALTTSGTLTNTGTVAVGANAASFAGYAGAGGTVTLTGGGSLTNTGAASTVPTLTLTGAVTLAGGSGLTATAATYTSSPSVTTTGTVNLPGGTLGALTLTSGALTLGSAATTVTSATLTAGTLTLTGNLTSSGALSGAGTLALGGNTLSFATLSMTSGTITTTSGTLTATGAGGALGTLTVTTGATLNGGSGASGLVVANAVAGNLALTGKVTLNGSVGTVSTSGPLTLNGALTTSGTLTNTGTVAVGANAASFAGYAGAGGTVTVTSGGSLTNTGVASTVPTLTLTGAVTLAGGSGLTATAATYTSSPSITTTGTVNLPGGTLGALTLTSGALTLGSAATTVTSATLTAGTLTLTGNLTSSGALSGAGTLALGGNTLSFATLSMTSGTITTTGGTLTATGAGGTVGTLTVTTGATLNGGSGASGLVVANAVAGNLALTGKVTLNGSVGTVSTSGTLTLNGALTTSGTLTNTGTVAVAGQTLTLASYTGTTDTVTIANGTLALTGTASTVTTLTVATGATLQGGPGLTLTNPVTGALTTTGLVNLNGTGVSTLTVSSGTLKLNGDLTVASALDATGGNVDLGGAHTLTLNSGSLGGTIDNSGAGGTFASSSSLTLTADTSITTGTSSTGTLSLGAVGATTAGAQALTLAGGTLTASGTLGSPRLAAFTATAGTSASVASVLAAGAVVLTAPALTLNGTLDSSLSSGSALTLTGPVTLGAAATLRTAGGLATATSTLNGTQAFTLDLGGGTFTSAGPVGGTAALGAVTLTSGAWSLGTNAAAFAGGLTQAGGTLSHGGTLTLSGTGSQSYDFSTSTLMNLALNKASGTATLAAATTVGGALTLTSGTLALGGNTLQFATVSGTAPITTTSGTLEVTGAGGTLGTLTVTTGATLKGGPGLTITNAVAGALTTQGTVTLNGTAVSLTNTGTVKLNGALTLSSFLDTSGGTVDLNGSRTLTLNTGSLGGTISNSGIGGTFTSSTSLTLTAATSIATGGGTLSINTANGAYDLTLTSGTLTATGALGASTRLTSLTATAATTASLKAVATTGAQAVTGPTSVTLSGAYDSQLASGPALTFTGPVILGGSTTFRTAGATGSHSSTLEPTTASSQGLTIDMGTGAFTSLGTVGAAKALGPLVLTSGTYNAATATLGGGLSRTSGVLVSTGTLTLGGTSSATFDFTSSTLNHLTVSKTSGTATVTSPTVGGNLTLAQGNLTLGSGTLTVAGNAASGTVASANLDLTAGDLDVTGTFTLTSGTVTVGTGQFLSGAYSQGGGTFSQTGDNSVVSKTQRLASVAVTGGSMTWDAANQGGTLEITGNLSSNGAVSFQRKNLTLGGTIAGAVTVLDLVVPSGKTLKPTGALTVRRHLTLDSGGAYDKSGAVTLTLGGGTGEAGTLTDSNASANDLGTVVVSGAAKTLGSNLKATTLTVTGVTLTLAGFNLTVAGALTGTGTLDASTGTPTLTVEGNLTVAAYTQGAGDTVALTSSTSSTLGPVGGYGVTNLTLAKTGGAAVTPAGPINVDGTLTLTSGTWSAGATTLTTAGDWNSSSITFQKGTGTVILTSANPTVTHAAGAGFQNLTVQQGATLGSDLAVAGTLSVGQTTPGTLDAQASARKLSVTGTTTITSPADVVWTNTGNTFGGTVTATTAGTALFSLTAAADLTFGPVSAAGDVTLSTPGTLTLGAALASTGGSVSLTGTTKAALNHASVGAANDITVAGPAVLGTGVTFTGGSGGLVWFKNTLGGGATSRTLTVATAGARFDGAVGGAGNLVASVAVDGAAALNGATVTTTGAQTYTGAVTLGAATTLTGGSGSLVWFKSTVGGGAAARALTVATANAQFDGAAGGAGNLLASLAVGGTTALNGASVATTGAQTYTGAVTLGADTTLTGGSGSLVWFKGTVGGGSTARSLTVATANAQFDGAAGGAGNLLSSVLVGGTTALNGSTVTTTGAQTYTGAVTLGAATALTGGSGSLVWFKNTVGGGTTARALTVATANAQVDGAAGGVGNLLASLAVGGTTALNGAAVTTTGAQTYTGAVTLGASTTLAGTTLTFGDPVTGAGFDLTLTGNAVVGDAATDTVTGVGTLTVSGTTTLNAATITTAGPQTYTGAFTLVPSATLTATASAIWLKAALAGGAQNLTLGSGTGSLRIDGAVTNLGNGTGAALTVPDGVGTLTFGAAVTAANGLAIGDGPTPATGAAAFAGALTVTGTSTPTAFGQRPVTFSGNVSLAGAAAFEDGGAVTFAGSGAQTFQAETSLILDTVAVNGPTSLVIGPKTAATAFTLTLTDTLTLTTGSLTFQGTFAGGSGSVVNGSGAAITWSNPTTASTSTVTWGTYTPAGAATVLGGGGTLVLVPHGQTAADLSVTGSTTVTLTDDILKIADGKTLSVASGSTLTFASTAAYGATKHGLWLGSGSAVANAGTFTAVEPSGTSEVFLWGTGATRATLSTTGAGRFLFPASGAPTLGLAGVIVASSFDLPASGQTLTLEDSTVRLDGALTLGAGTTLDFTGLWASGTAHDAELKSHLTVNATASLAHRTVGATTAKVTFSGTSTLTLGNTAPARQLQNVVVALGGSLTLATAAAVTDTLTQAAGSTFDLGGQTLLVGGNLTIGASTASAFVSAGSTVSLEGTSTVTSNQPFGHLFVNAPGGTVTAGSNLTTTGRFAAFRGTWAANGKNLTVGEDFVAYGAAFASYTLHGVTYHPADDGERAATRGATTYQNRLGYPSWAAASGRPTISGTSGYSALANLAFPGHAVWAAVGTAYATGGYENVIADTETAAFTFTGGETLTVAGNFYNAGASMTGAAGWNLVVPAPFTSKTLTAAPATDWFGVPFAVAVATASGMSITNSTSNHPVAAAQTTVAGTYTAGTGASPPVWASAVTVDAASQTGLWDATAPDVDTVVPPATRFDDVVEVTFTEALRNAAGEAAAAVDASALATGSTLDALRLATGATKAGAVLDFSAPTASTTAASHSEYLLAAAANADKAVLSFQTRTDAAAPSWNTDATGTSAGAAASTDRAGVHQTVVPDLTFEKGRLFDAAGNPIVNHDALNWNGAAGAVSARVTSTVDKTRPVLVKVTTAQAAKHFPATTPQDGHNLWHLEWSEAVDLAGHASLGTTASVGTAPNAAAQTAANPAVTPAFGDSFSASAGTVTVTSLFDYTGTLYRSTRTWGTAHSGADPTSSQTDASGDKTSNSLARTSAHSLEVYLAGASTGTGTSQVWDGFWWGATEPAGASYTVPAAYADAVTDLDGNKIETANVTWAGPHGTDPKAGFTIAAQTAATAGGTWELDTPKFAGYTEGGGAEYEVVPLDRDHNDLIDRIDFHLLSNTTLSHQTWDSSVGHLVASGQRANTATWGVRDSSLTQFHQGLTLSLDGTTFASTTLNVPLDSSAPYDGNTTVNNSLFNGDPQSPTTIAYSDDGYFSMDLDETASGFPADWQPANSFYVKYNPFAGMATNLAGRLVEPPSSTWSDPFRAIDRTVPRVALTLTGHNLKKVYVQFSRRVTVADQAHPETSFVLVKASDGSVVSGNSIVDLTPLAGGSLATSFQQALLTLAQPLTAGQVLGWRLRAASDTAVGISPNYLDDTVLIPLTNVGLDLVQPVWASDGAGGETDPAGVDHIIHDFTGAAALTPKTVEVQARVWTDGSDTTLTDLPLRLFYDLDVPSSAKAEKLWLPSGIFTYVPGPRGADVVPGTSNTAARYVDPFHLSTDRALRNFRIPGNDSEVAVGHTLEFLFRLGSLDVARSLDPDDPTKLAPWYVPFQSVRTQKNGVTILHNVINPTQGEKVQVLYDMPKTGVLTATVFALDGSAVKVLQRGRQASGSYSLTWDGRNESGEMVARGVYFIRVVGPSIDETRNVLVIK